MKTNRKNTHAIKYLMDEVTSPEDFMTATPEKVDGYLTSKGFKLGEVDGRMQQFLGRLGGKIAYARAAQEPRTAADLEKRRAQLSKLTDAEILDRLIAKYGRQEDIPLAARTKGAFGRKELESLYLDAGDEI